MAGSWQGNAEEVGRREPASWQGSVSGVEAASGQWERSGFGSSPTIDVLPPPPRVPVIAGAPSIAPRKKSGKWLGVVGLAVGLVIGVGAGKLDVTKLHKMGGRVAASIHGGGRAAAPTTPDAPSVPAAAVAPAQGVKPTALPIARPVPTMPQPARPKVGKKRPVAPGEILEAGLGPKAPSPESGMLEAGLGAKK